MTVNALRTKPKKTLLNKVEEIHKDVMQIKKAFGFQMIQRPSSSMPELDQDFTLFDPEGLGSTFSEFTRWSQYAMSLVTEYEIEVSLYKEAQRLKKLQLESKGLKTDVEYEEISLGKLKAEVKLKSIEGMYKALLLGQKSLSREISRRSLDMRSTNVNENNGRREISSRRS